MTNIQVALLRGINVGGHAKLPMADLRRLLSDLGARNPRTYIQSGNAVFEGQLKAEDISNAINAAFGFRPRCLVLSGQAFLDAAAANPFDTSQPKLVHLSFLAAQPAFDETDLAKQAINNEKWLLRDRVFYLYTPEGYSNSKIPDRIERQLGVAATARNWNTVSGIVGMIKGA